MTSLTSGCIAAIFLYPFRGWSHNVKLRYFLAICIAIFTSHAFGQRLVKFPLQDGPVEVQADLYGSGTRGVVLAHGGRFHKESWKKQAQTLASWCWPSVFEATFSTRMDHRVQSALLPTMQRMY
jgi:hypothetical protein